MKFIKKNKFTIIAIVCFLILMLLAVQIKNVFFPSDGGAIYGDRLDGIDKVRISKSKLNKIEDKLNENENITEVDTFIKGKILNVIVTINDAVSLEDAKNIPNTVVEQLNGDQKDFYDIQVIINKENESSQFPIIGYKHHSKDNFSFNKDREEQAEAES